MLIFDLLMAAGNGGQFLAVGQNGVDIIPKFFNVGISAAQQISVSGLVEQSALGLVSWSEDAATFASYDTNGENIVYSREGFQFTPKEDALTGLLGGRAMMFSPGATHLAIGGSTSPYLAIYKKGVDGEYDKLASTPGTAPTGSVNGCSFSPDGTFLAVAHRDSPYISIYSVSGDTFTKLSNPSSLPLGDGQSAKWSPNGTYLAVTFTHGAGSNVYVYKRSGSSFTKLTTPPGATTMGSGRDAAFSADGTFLAASFAFNEPVIVWQRTNDTFTKLVEITNVPQFVECCAWSPDNNFLALGGQGGDGLAVYRRNGTTFTKVNLIASEALSAILSIGFFPPAVPGSG